MKAAAPKIPVHRGVPALPIGGKATVLANVLLTAFGAWCGAYVVVAAFAPQWEGQISTLFFLGVVAVGPAAFLVRPQLPRAWSASLTLVCLLALAIALSVVANLEATYLRAIVPLAVAQIAVLFVLTHLATAFRDSLRWLYGAFVVMGIASLLAVWAIQGPLDGGRLGGILSPNAIGMLGASVACAAQAVRWHALRACAIALAFPVILASGSRSALLGALVGLTAPYLIVQRGRVRRILLGTALFATAALGAYALGIDSGRIEETVDQALALSDPYRGLDSGFTGRTGAWELGFKLWIEAPIFGHGYRSQEELFAKSEDNLDNNSSTHNGWIAILTDLGIFGFLPYASLIAIALVRLYASDLADDTMRASGSLVIGYCFLVLFERYALNTGNPVSILFLLSVLFLCLSPKNESSRSLSVQGPKTRGISNQCAVANKMPLPLSRTS